MKALLGVTQKVFVTIGIMIVVLIAATYFLLDSAAKSAIETVISDVTQTRGTISSLEISTIDGTGRISGLRMSNPEGFATNESLSFSEIEIEIDVTTLTGDVIHVKKIEVIKPEIIYELTDKNSNIETIGANARDYVSKGGNAEPEKKFTIDEFCLTDGTIKLVAPLFGDDKADIPLSSIQMQNIGQGDGPAEIVQHLVFKLADSIISAVDAVNVTDLLGDTGSALVNSRQALGETARDAVEAIAEGPPETASTRWRGRSNKIDGSCPI